MPVHVLLDGDGAGPGAQLPAHLKRIPVSLISIGVDTTDNIIKGKVVQKGPLVALAADNFLLKTVIQEEDSSQMPSINVILLGALASDFSENVNQGDIVAASGFSVSKSPTVHKDNLHACNLLLSKDDACIYVFRSKPPCDPRSRSITKRIATRSAESSKTAKIPKYSYTRLDELKASAVVNVYGVVLFFKQPFKSRGTDWCSSLKITDQSNRKISCNIFCDNLESHPKIFQIGDIVRMHRVKTKLFNNSFTLVNTFGFSAVTFDGVMGRDVIPQTSSQSFTFEQEDQRMVEELRTWAASQSLVPPVSKPVPLSAVQPLAYFDLTCQLLAKAAIDTSCALLRVWDGTKCPYNLVKVIAGASAIEGPSSFSHQKENLIANILIYDNHVEFAQQLKPGAFLRIYNLRALQGIRKIPDHSKNQTMEGNYLTFHLHGGSSFGRGIRVLPENCTEVQELKRVLESLESDEIVPPDVSDSELLEEQWGTPPEYLDADVMTYSTERNCDHTVPLLSLSELKKIEPGPAHHVRVQLSSFQPQRLHQALKLFCSKCSSMQDIPDDETVDSVFSEACRDLSSCRLPLEFNSGQVILPRKSPQCPQRVLDVHLSSHLLTEDRGEELVFIRGSTLEETCQLADSYQNIVPVRSSEGHLALLDLSAPFLFRGRRRYYGCKQCSQPAARTLSHEKVELIDEKIVAKALGIELLQPVLLMELQLQDATDTLDVFLWRHAESFLGVKAEDAAINQEAQDRVKDVMNSLCPPGGSAARCPWLDLCLMAYRVKDEGQSRTCYQICQTVATQRHRDP